MTRQVSAITNSCNDNSKLKVAMCAVPMFGHFMPLLPYAEELIRRGHSVTIFHESDPKYRRKIEQCGLDDCISVPYESKEHRKWKDPMYGCLRSHYDDPQNEAPDVMVYDFFATDAADVADQLGIPAIGIFPNPRSINPWAATLAEQGTLKWKIWSFFCTSVLEGVIARLLWCMRAKARWSRSLPILREQDFYPSPYMPRHILGSMAPTLEFPNLPQAPLYHMVGPSLPTHTDPLSSDLQQWLDRAQQQNVPVVYVAFGTQYRHTPESVRKLQADLLEAGVAVIWSLPEKDQAALVDTQAFSSQFRVESFVPQVALLQSGKVSAFVTHCGSNSMNEALLAGVPMVACPGFADQPANASRLARAGVGIVANKKMEVGMALRQLLDNLDKMEAASQKLSTELQSLNAAKQGVHLIEVIAKEEYMGHSLKGPTRWSLWPMVIVAVALPLLL